MRQGCGFVLVAWGTILVCSYLLCPYIASRGIAPTNYGWQVGVSGLITIFVGLLMLTDKRR